MPCTRIRRLLIVQGAVLLAGWFAILVSQAAARQGTVQSLSTGIPHNASPSALIEGVGVVAALVAFAWAGKIRAEINRSLPSSTRNDDLKLRAIEAA